MFPKVKRTSRLRLKRKLKSIRKSNAFKTRKSMKINVICTVVDTFLNGEWQE